MIQPAQNRKQDGHMKEKKPKEAKDRSVVK